MRHATLALALALAACGTTEHAPERADSLDIELAYVDGAGIERHAQFIDAELLDDGALLRYHALIDGQPRTIDYAQYASGEPLVLSVAGPNPRHDLAMRFSEEGAELVIAGERVGAFDWSNDARVETARGADPISFAALSLFPHQVEGLRPADLFAYSETELLDDGLGQARQGKITLKGILKAIGGLFSGGARADCEKLPDICSQMGTESPDGNGCSSGSACGRIRCCAGSCQTGGYSYGASIGDQG